MNSSSFLSCFSALLSCVLLALRSPSLSPSSSCALLYKPSISFFALALISMNSSYALSCVIERLLLLCGSEWAILTLLLGGLWLLELAVGDGSGVSLGDIDNSGGANDV